LGQTACLLNIRLARERNERNVWAISRDFEHQPVTFVLARVHQQDKVLWQKIQQCDF
jgi:hypothetical protein